MAKAILVALLILSSAGCTPLINNVVQLGCGEDKVSLTNKGESDQTPSTTTHTALPVSVGAQPNSTGTVGK